jgi:hypothetical protein
MRHDGCEQGIATIMALNPAAIMGVIFRTNQGKAELDEILAEAYRLGLVL